MAQYKVEELETISRAAAVDGANERTYRRYAKLGLAEVVHVGGRALLTPQGREQCRALYGRHRERCARSTTVDPSHEA